MTNNYASDYTPRTPVKVKLYAHQQTAFEQTCRHFGLTEGGDAASISKKRGYAYFMEMG